MKKLLTLMLLAGASFAGLVGCGSDNTGNAAESNNTNNEGSETKEPTTIKLWLDNEVLAETLVPAIEEALPHITIQFEKVTAIDALQKLQLDGPAGLGADVFIQPHDAMATSIELNVLLPIGDEMETMVANRFLEGSVKTVQLGDDMYGVPLLTESLALFYNKTLLEENGLEVATTMEEIKEQAAVYNNTSENKFIFRFVSGDAYASHFNFTASGYKLYGENSDDPTKVNYDTPEFVAGLETYSELKDILPVPAADLNYDTVMAPFAKGEVPYILTGPWSIGEFEEGAQTHGFEFGVSKIPTINGVQPRTFSGNQIACISAYTEKASAAREVVNFLASPEGLKVLFDASGKIPALKDNSVVDGVLENQHIVGILDQAQYSDPMPVLADMSYYWVPTITALTSVWDGLATPEEAAIKAMEDYKTSQSLTK